MVCILEQLYVNLEIFTLQLFYLFFKCARVYFARFQERYVVLHVQQGFFCDLQPSFDPVSYTHLTLPTKA